MNPRGNHVIRPFSMTSPCLLCPDKDDLADTRFAMCNSSYVIVMLVEFLRPLSSLIY